MPSSQLKQLKASLRDQGIVGQQKSKKKRKQDSRDIASKQKRNTALQGIREKFNPFEVRAPGRREKFEVIGGRERHLSHGRPGVTKGLGEERRQATILKEMQSRNKVGRIIDRRYGENDSTMTAEQRAAERFARQSDRQSKKRSLFNLEDDIELTHLGRSLDARGEEIIQDDFKAIDLSSEGDDVGEFAESNGSEDDLEPPSKGPALLSRASENELGPGFTLSDQKRSKQEVMEEVMSKSKLYKHERQRAKEDDDDLRAELDKGLPEFMQSIRDYRNAQSSNLNTKTSINPHPARAALMAGQERYEVDFEYNEKVRQMAQDPRSKPSGRTRTDEEIADERATRLRELEEERMRRMRGDAEPSEAGVEPEDEPSEDLIEDDANAFGLSQTLNGTGDASVLDVEGEDDFVLDDDLIANDSEIESYTSDEEASPGASGQLQDDGDDDFINGIVLPLAGSHGPEQVSRLADPPSDTLSFTYKCPTTHSELLDITRAIDVKDTPTVVQRIRALHHPKLDATNKEKLEVFSAVLLDHVVYLAKQQPRVPSSVLEGLLRHLHSLAKSYPFAIAAAFRNHLKQIAEDRPLRLRPSDFIVLTAISTIFPTSDHFHSVVTPATLIMTRFLAQGPRSELRDFVKGAYCCSLVLQYQSLSKRYVPEAITYIQQALIFLTNVPKSNLDAVNGTRNTESSEPRPPANDTERHSRLQFSDLYSDDEPEQTLNQTKVEIPIPREPLISHFLTLLITAAEMLHTQPSFPEIFSPTTHLLHTLLQNPTPALSTLHTHLLSTLTTLSSLTSTSLSTRRPLLLHTHKPLAIKTSFPKLDPSYQPHQPQPRSTTTTTPVPVSDPSTLASLRLEHKRERKGALRELRKDANFIAREQLKRKRARDEEHERKMRRLVGEIQAQEGQEAGRYERARKRGR